MCRALSCVCTVYMNMGTKMLCIYELCILLNTIYYLHLQKKTILTAKQEQNETTIKTKTTI